MDIKQTKVSDITPYPKNAKKHPKKQIEQIAASIKEFGFNQPVVMDKNGVVIVGHGRLEAAKMLGVKEVPTITVDLPEDKAKAYRLADNKLNESDWEMGLVIEELDLLPLDLQVLTGFNSDDLNINMDSIATGRSSNNWNYNYKNLEQHGDGLEGKIGFNPHSMWYSMSRNYGDIEERLIKLPDQTKSKNPHKDKYSRTSPESIRRIVKMYMREGDYFLENCCGWSTFGFIAADHGYNGVGVDIWDVALEKSKQQVSLTKNGKVEIREMDGMKLEFQDATFDYVYCNPPFMDAEMYSGLENDLATKNQVEFESKFEKLMSENARVVKKNGLVTITISDQRKNGVLRSHQAMVINLGLKAGLQLYDFVIVEQLGVANMYRKKAYEKRRSPKNHEYVITFIKH
jgi:ubiquinone/menaquinone biosynthesis C-methylase UbiE